MDASPILRLQNVVKKFGTFTALHGIDLDIYDGEFLTIVGPSGSGKSTLIRILVGMEDVSDGEIWLRDQRIDQTPANKRPTCMVFQSLALFPHMSVGHNIEFPLKIQGAAPTARKARALELMALLHLPDDYYTKRISQCSGGERQRVALARALAFDPEILFFDEPLSAIDYKLRKTLEKELKDIHRETGKTFIYITHSLEEAMVMSDRIGIMRAGHLEQVGSPDEIYNQPRSRFVSEFMGEVNVIEVEAAEGGRLQCAGLSAEFSSPSAPNGFARGHLVIRPEYLRFLGSAGEADNTIEGTLYNEYSLGSRIQYQVRVGERVFLVEKLREQRYEGALDDRVTIGWDARDSILVAE